MSTFAFTALLLAIQAAPAQEGVAAPTRAPVAASAPAPTASAPTAADLTRKVQAYYERTRDLQAGFTQTWVYAGAGRTLISTGTLKVKKPGLMRWDYLTPAVKVVAVTGRRLVQYEPEERQAYVEEQFDASGMTAAVGFLVGQGDLARDFTPALGEGGTLVLRPRVADPRVARITFTVGPDGEVLATAVLDGSGNENRLVFTAIRRNGGLADAAFEVKLPAGTRRVGK
jgi:outer membrane lipoprotein carrier protein